MRKLKVGITIGDINGIGPEVIIKTFSSPKMLEMCIPIIYGSSKVMSYHKNIVKTQDFSFISTGDASRASSSKVNVVNCWDEDVKITLGEATEQAGKLAHIAMDRALQELKNNELDAVVTAPINKEAMNMADFPYPGHTEFFTKNLDKKESLMMMVSDNLRIALATNHLPLSEVTGAITKETLVYKLKIFNKSLIEDFGIDKPTIAILGLNPHAGDNGVIGSEEDEIIRPVIIEAKKNGVHAVGPYAADGFFGSSQFTKVDGIFAMYHDQGLIPFKALTFGSGVNFTAGLPIVRTSPDHGTGYDIAGKNQADHSSFRAAVYQALDIARSRKDYIESRENKLQKREKPAEGRGRRDR